MSRAQCEICGETKFDSWSYCPACGHPYPDDDESDEDAEDDWDDDDTEGSDDDGELDD